MANEKKSIKIATDGGSNLTQNAFANLSSLPNLAALPQTPPALSAEHLDAKSPTASPKKTTLQSSTKNRGRVDVIREKAGRGGKTVTVVSGFIGIGLPEKEMLAKKMRAACGTGGTVKDGRIEIQGDKRAEIARILAEAGFRPVFAGG